MDLVRREDGKDGQLIAKAQSSYRPLRRPAVVLEEDDYIDGLSEVVRKKFFPEPAGLEATEHASSEARVESDLTVTGYQAKYTSEDNAGFLDILDRQNLLNRERHSWHYNNNKIYSENTERHQKRSEDQKKVGWIDDRDSIAGWRVSPKNALMFQPEGLVHERPTDPVATSSTVIHYEATRMPADQPLSTAARPTWVSVASDMDEPTVNGYGFVDEPETPLPTSTANPFPEPRAQSLAKSFVIPDTSAREKVHERLLEKTRRASTSRTPITALKRATATPKFKSSPVLSPAAHRLMAGNAGLRTRLKTPAKGSQLR